MREEDEPRTAGEPFDPATITRPDPSLLNYYIIIAVLTGPFFPITFLPLFFKFKTLKYRFDDSGVSMSWGILWKREIHLTYRRIQDIHLTRNIIQRWMKLATVGIQTASGSSSPEMSIEGILEAAPLRDHLYKQMRGARGETEPQEEAATATRAAEEAGAAPAVGTAETAAATGDPGQQALALLVEIRDLLKERAEGRKSDGDRP